MCAWASALIPFSTHDFFGSVSFECRQVSFDKRWVSFAYIEVSLDTSLNTSLLWHTSLLRTDRSLLTIDGTVLHTCIFLYSKYESLLRLFCIHKGLFCIYKGLFCVHNGPCCVHNGLFCTHTGLYSQYMCLFCIEIGLF